MNNILIATSGILSLFVFMFLFRMPVAFALAITGFAGFGIIVNFKAALTMLGTELWNNLSSYGLASIPFFLLMGNICLYSGISKKLYDTAYKWIGDIRGGVAIATVFACAGFSSICGSNAATSATMTSIAMPEMKKYGYNPVFSAGTIASASTLGVVIPPSVVLIVIGLSTGESIGKLFVASTIPGIISAIIFAITAYIIAVIKKDWGPAGEKTSWLLKIKSIPGTFEIFLLFIFMIYGMYKGWFSATEAGAAGSVFVLILTLFFGSLTLDKLKKAMEDTVRTSCMIILIIAGAVIFGKFLTVTRLPFELSQWISSLDVPSWLVMIFIVIIFIIGGAIMDALGFLMITMPIVFPLAEKLGYDPVWFSIFLTLLTTLGAITPPVGINVFVVAGISQELTLEEVFRGACYYLWSFALIIILMMLFPSMVTFLPSLIK